MPPLPVSPLLVSPLPVAPSQPTPWQLRWFTSDGVLVPSAEDSERSAREQAEQARSQAEKTAAEALQAKADLEALILKATGMTAEQLAQLQSEE